MRASDADRGRTVELLAQAYADGRLTLTEHSDRIDAAWAAKTVGDLAPLTADLGPAPVAVPGVPAPAVVASPGDPLRVVQVFSSGVQHGDWLVPAQINAFVLFGSSRLDMRAAAFASLAVDVQVNVMFGGAELYVPAGVTVIDETLKLFGGVQMKGMGTAAPGAPVIRLKGFVLFGGVEVRGGDYKTLGQRLGFTR